MDSPGKMALTKAVVEVLVSNPAESDPVFSEPLGYTFTVVEDSDMDPPSTGQTIGTVGETQVTEIKSIKIIQLHDDFVFF